MRVAALLVVLRGAPVGLGRVRCGREAERAGRACALKTRLAAQHLRVRHVYCIVNGRVYKQHGIVRCNVDFGEPHITAYCSVLIGGRLLTQFDVKAIPCHRDNAGSKDIIVSSG